MTLEFAHRNCIQMWIDEKGSEVCEFYIQIRTKMVAPGGEALGGVIGAFRHMLQTEGFFLLYKGLLPSIISMAPSGAVFYGVYAILKAAYLHSPEGRKRLSQMNQQDHELSAFDRLLYGAIAGACAEAATYPFEVIRRQLQMQVQATKMNAFATCMKIVEHGGVPALYAGLVPNLLQIYEIVKLADDLLPPLPQGTILLPICSNILVKGSATMKSLANTSSKQDTNETSTDILAREKLLQDQPELLQQFGLNLLPVLTQIYGSSVNAPVRHKCLSAIGKLMYFSSADMIHCLLSVTNISSFLAGVLAWKDPQVLIPALQIADILMEKLPETCSKMFVREGVVHAVDSLICSDSSSSVLAQSPSEKDSDPSHGTSRSRRYRRRSGSSNTENSSLDENKASASVPTSVDIPGFNSSLRGAVSERAKAFKEKYFPVDGTTAVGVTDNLLHLKNLCAKLNASVEDVKTKGKGKD